MRPTIPDCLKGAEEVAAILCADLHLCHRPPLARSVEEDWYAVQKGCLQQLAVLQSEYGVPVVCAGDIFDRYDPPPELLSFALRYLPHLHAVPGQHDLPHHRYGDMRKSAYGVLVEAGKITNLKPGKPYELHNLVLYSFPWGYEVKPCKRTAPMLGLRIAVIHSFIWTAKTGYEGAPEEKRLGAYPAKLKGYDVAVFGDNHKPFTAKAGETTVFNCGGFMRRRSDERNHRPRVGLLYGNGTVKSYYLDVAKDKFLEDDKAEQDPQLQRGLEDFFRGLGELKDQSLDFRASVEKYLHSHPVEESVERYIRRSLLRKEKP